jgi:perosamine synthetase
MSEIIVPLSRPSLKGNETRYVLECLETSWISGRGRFVIEFEQQFAAKIGGGHALATCNGTAALHLAIAAVGIGPGDEVIVPTLTYIASVNAIARVGATPVFADCLPDTWQIDPEEVASRVTSKTKAIVAVHLYGQSCDMDRLMTIARRHDLFVIEDCAEAFGTRYRNRPAGLFGNIAAFSFFGNKTITTGEGGMVISRDDALIDRCRRLRGQGLVPGREYWHDRIGYNYRMSNIAAAIGLAQLERSDELLYLKRQLAEKYFQRLSRLPLTLHREIPGTVHSYWMVSVLARNEPERDALRRHLAEHAIETRPLFYPVHTMGIYPHYFREKTVAEEVAARGLNLEEVKSLGNGLVFEENTAAEIAACIARAQREIGKLRERAAMYAKKFSSENGADRCVDAIESLFANECS